MYDLLKEFIRPELLVLVPVLYLIGLAVKRSVVNDKLIPWILGAVSVVLCTAYIVAAATITGWQAAVLAAFTAVTQGVLIAGASVYVNQLVKQAGK